MIVADDAFTVKKPLRFKSEGSTMSALTNARMIADAGYSFAHGTVRYDDTFGGIQEMEAFFRRDDEVASRVFRGFNFGYGGEGPRGMIEFSQMFFIALDSKKILSHDYRASLPKKGTFDLVQLLG
jgi:hypothetical protein